MNPIDRAYDATAARVMAVRYRSPSENDSAPHHDDSGLQRSKEPLDDSTPDSPAEIADGERMLTSFEQDVQNLDEILQRILASDTLLNASMRPSGETSGDAAPPSRFVTW